MAWRFRVGGLGIGHLVEKYVLSSCTSFVCSKGIPNASVVLSSAYRWHGAPLVRCSIQGLVDSLVLLRQSVDGLLVELTPR